MMPTRCAGNKATTIKGGMRGVHKERYDRLGNTTGPGLSGTEHHSATFGECKQLKLPDRVLVGSYRRVDSCPTVSSELVMLGTCDALPFLSKKLIGDVNNF